MNKISSIVHSRDKDRLVLKVGNAFDIFTVEGENIVMLRTAPAKNKGQEKSLEAIFDPEWIHEIDDWYRERKLGRLLDKWNEGIITKERAASGDSDGSDRTGS